MAKRKEAPSGFDGIGAKIARQRSSVRSDGYRLDSKADGIRHGGDRRAPLDNRMTS
jgi:hypothetical protein